MKSKISASISKQQILNQVIYNRAIVQMGIAAFRLGYFVEANQALMEVCQSPKVKESLAQGSSFNRQQEKTQDEEMEEKKRQVPPHLQINLDLLDSVYMTTSLMLEVPNISENKFDVHRKVISRNFRKLIEQYDLKGIQFVAQSSRDFIVNAARYIHQSKWQQAYDCICQVKVFQRMQEFQNGSLK